MVAGTGATSFQPCSGLRCGLRLSAGARQLSGRGAWGLLEDREQGFLARSVHLGARGPCQYHS